MLDLSIWKLLLIGLGLIGFAIFIQYYMRGIDLSGQDELDYYEPENKSTYMSPIKDLWFDKKLAGIDSGKLAFKKGREYLVVQKSDEEGRVVLRDERNNAHTVSSDWRKYFIIVKY